MSRELVTKLGLEIENDFEGRSKPKSNFEKNPVLEEINYRFKKHLKDQKNLYNTKPVPQYIQEYSISEILNQVQIQNFIDNMPSENQREVGLFISCLINCCKEDYFIFDVTNIDQEMTYLGYGLENKNLEIIGNAGSYCGYRSIDCTFLISGNAGYCFGNKSIGCNYLINGNTENFLGRDSKNCSFTFFGDVGRDCGKGSDDCTFKAVKRSTYEEICNSARKSNKIQLIDKNGNVLEERLNE